AADHLLFSNQPADTVVGVQLHAVTVQILDPFNNVVTNSSNSVTLSLDNNPGNATLSGTRTLPATGGAANFTDLTIDKPGDNYTLLASSGSLAGVVSTGFRIISTAATHLTF